MKKTAAFVSLILLVVFMAGCAAHIHTVGTGGTGGQSEAQRQWYVLWGLVPINHVDTHAMAASATDYTIKTQQSALDVVINVFTSFVTVNSRTVTVTK